MDQLETVYEQLETGLERVLSAAEQSAMRAEVKDYLEEEYFNISSGDRAEVLDPQEAMQMLVEFADNNLDEVALADDVVDAERWTVIEVFVDELLSFIEEKEANKHEFTDLDLYRFSKEVAAEVFSANSRYLKGFSSKKLITFAARASRVLEGDISTSYLFIEELVSRSLSEDVLLDIRRSIHDLPVSEQIDVIQLLAVLYVEMQEIEDFPVEKISELKYIMRIIAVESKSAFLNYAVHDAIDNMDRYSPAGKRESTGMMPSFRLDADDKKTKAQSSRLHKILDGSKLVEEGANLSLLSRDFIGLNDESGTPRFIGKMNRDILQKEALLEYADLVESKKFQLKEKVTLLQNMFLKVGYAKKQIADFLFRECGGLSIEEWGAVLVYAERVTAIRNQSKMEMIRTKDEFFSMEERVVKELVEEAGEDFKKVYEYISKEEGAVGHFLEVQYKGMMKAIKEKHYAQALEYMNALRGDFIGRDKVLSLLGFPFCKEEQLLVDLPKRIQKEVQSRRSNCTLKMSEIFIQESAEVSKEEVSHSELLNKLSQNEGQVTAAIDLLVERLLSGPSNFEFVGMNILSPENKESLSGYYESVDVSEKMLLLQHLHRPGMKSQVQADLGVAFEELSLRAQFHLLSILQNMDRIEYEDFRHVILRSANPVAVFESFTACAQNPQMAGVILELSKHPEAEQLFVAYAQSVENAHQTSEKVIALAKEAGNEMDEKHVFRSLIKRNNKVLQKALKQISRGKNIEGLAEKIFHQNETIRATADIVAALPPASIGNLDLNTLSTVRLSGAIDGKAFRFSPQYKKVYDRAIETIRKNFPEGDDEDFADVYLMNNRSQVVFSTVGEDEDERLLAFFGLEDMGNGVRYLDWFNTDSDAPVTALGEATLKTALKNLEQQGYSYYAVAKPYVKSAEISSQLGMVFFGITEPGEYQHSYIRLRRLREEEAQKYVGQQLDKKDMKQIATICEEENTLIKTTIRGKDVLVCKTSFKNKNHHDNVLPSDPEGWLMKTVDDIGKGNNYVMSRYFSAPESTHQHQVYYAVFEPSQLSLQKYTQLMESIHDHHLHQN